MIETLRLQHNLMWHTTWFLGEDLAELLFNALIAAACAIITTELHRRWLRAHRVVKSGQRPHVFEDGIHELFAANFCRACGCTSK